MEKRRSFLKKGITLALAGVATPVLNSVAIAAISPLQADAFKQSPLPYSFDALEPHIDKKTMEIHYGKHHAAYVKNLNEAVAAEKISQKTLEDLMKNISKYTNKVRNNGGGHYNHEFFWKIMKSGGSRSPKGALADAINSSFGSFDKMKQKFNEAAMGRFGSGWAWLVKNGNKLEIGSTPNQDNPLMDVADFKGQPILGLDVWEHAYYLNYQNERKKYVEAWWNVVNFDEAEKLFSAKN